MGGSSQNGETPNLHGNPHRANSISELGALRCGNCGIGKWVAYSRHDSRRFSKSVEDWDVFGNRFRRLRRNTAVASVATVLL